MLHCRACTPKTVEMAPVVATPSASAVSAIHDHGLLDRDGLRPAASEHAVVQALADFPRCRFDVLQTDAGPSLGAGLNPALLADELDQVGGAARLVHSQLRSVGVPVHLQVQRWFHECSLRRVSVQADVGAELLGCGGKAVGHGVDRPGLGVVNDADLRGGGGHVIPFDWAVGSRTGSSGAGQWCW